MAEPDPAEATTPAQSAAPEDSADGRGRLLRLLAHPAPRLALLAGLLVVATVLALRADDLSVSALRAVVEIGRAHV